MVLALISNRWKSGSDTAHFRDSGSVYCFALALFTMPVLHGAVFSEGGVCGAQSGSGGPSRGCFGRTEGSRALKLTECPLASKSWRDGSRASGP
jgi:hypothetical protein